MNKMTFLAILALALITPLTADAKPGKGLSLRGKVPGGTGYTALLTLSTGGSLAAPIGDNETFSFSKLQPGRLKGATLQFVDPAGRYFGPALVVRKGSTGYLTFSGKIPSKKKVLNLGKLILSAGYLQPKKALSAAIVDRKRKITLDSKGAPLGSGKLGLVVPAASQVLAQRVFAAAEGTPPDPDGDGIPNAFDVDDDGDGVLDGSDPDSARSTAAENPFSTLYLSMGQTLNVNIASVTQSQIDAVIAGENFFQFILYFSQAPDSTATGGHVICPASLPYCRSTADGGGTAVYTGVSESNGALRNQLWTNYNANGSGYPNLEPIQNNGQRALVAGVQPCVPTAQFQPGDVYRADFTDAGGTVVSSKTLTLSPYFVTVPALKSYDAGAGTVNVDYTDLSAPGTSMSSPIVLSADGLLRATFWRPQRLAISGAETGSFRDMGNLHYGVILSGQNGEVGCAGSYSALSGLTEAASIEPGSGESLWPLTDGSGDAAPSIDSTLAFTVNLLQCAQAAGFPPGNYNLTLTAAGEMLTGGANRAAQMITVTIPGPA